MRVCHAVVYLTACCSGTGDVQISLTETFRPHLDFSQAAGHVITCPDEGIAAPHDRSSTVPARGQLTSTKVGARCVVAQQRQTTPVQPAVPTFVSLQHPHHPQRPEGKPPRCQKHAGDQRPPQSQAALQPHSYMSPHRASHGASHGASPWRR